MFGHIRDKLFKKKIKENKKYIGFQWGMQLSLTANLVLS
jgi:hypothetical protein